MKIGWLFSPLPGPQASGVREGLYGLGLGALHKNEQILISLASWGIPPNWMATFFFLHLFSNGKRHKEAFFCHLFLKWTEAFLSSSF